MSWVQNSAKARHLFAAALLVTASAALADVLVVRSTGPSAKSFPPGKRLAETQRVTLRANDLLVVLSGNGTRNLRGPGTFTVGAPAAQTASAATTTQRRARIGAVRGTGTGPLRPPTIWHIDVARSSNICVADPTKVTLWRADSSRPTTLNVTRVADGSTRQVAWQAGASTLAWPAQMPVTDGGEFRLSWSGGAAPTALRFRTMPSRPAGLEDMASTLISKQCDAQMDLFIDTVRLPDDAAPAG